MATIPLFVLVMVAMAATVTAFPWMVSRMQLVVFIIAMVAILAVCAYVSFVTFAVMLSLLPLLLFIFAFGAIAAKVLRK